MKKRALFPSIHILFWLHKKWEHIILKNTMFITSCRCFWSDFSPIWNCFPLLVFLADFNNPALVKISFVFVWKGAAGWMVFTPLSVTRIASSKWGRPVHVVAPRLAGMVFVDRLPGLMMKWWKWWNSLPASLSLDITWRSQRYRDSFLQTVLGCPPPRFAT